MRRTDNKQFLCTHPGCGKVFNRRDYLERHAANHLKVKPFVCIQCNRQFSRKDLYDNHLTTKRHARVVQETQQASYDKQSAAELEFINSPTPASTTPNLLGSTIHLLESSSGSDSRDKDEEYHQSGLLYDYVPSVRPVSHHKGSGLGTAYSYPGGTQSQNSTQPSSQTLNQGYSSSNESGYQIYPESNFLANESLQPYIRANDTPAMHYETDLPWLNQYRRVSPMLADQISNKYLQSDRLSNYGRFSANGVSLGLDLSNSSSSTQSDVSSRDDFSDTDGTNAVNIVGERVKHDMSQSLYPFVSLRESPFTDPVESDKDSQEGEWLGGERFTESSSNSIGRKPIRNLDFTETTNGNKEPSLETVLEMTGDKRYTWFFDDIYETEKAKIGYDRCYSVAVDQYQRRKDEYSRQHLELGSNPSVETSIGQMSSYYWKDDKSINLLEFSNIFKPLSMERVSNIVLTLREVHPGLDTSTLVDRWIQSAWIQAEAVRFILHPATYDGNTSHYTLISVLALLGMALSEDKSIVRAARRAYAHVFLYTYDSLIKIPKNMGPNRLDTHTVNILQAFSLLLRYERLILIGDSTQVSFTSNSPGRYATDFFLSRALSLVSHTGEFNTSAKQQPIWATVTSEGYLFHQGADPESQWHEWALIEATKRTVHFSLYCDSIAIFNSPKPNPVSIFNMDIHMICPDSVWQSRSADEFLYIFGHTGNVTNVPYLGLIKSLIRFPRTAQSDDSSSPQQDLPQIGAPWSIFALKTVAHGLIMVVGKLSGLISHGDEMLQAVMNKSSDPKIRDPVFPKIDRRLQARLYRGLDVWYHYFSAAYGDLTDKILQVHGSMTIPLRDEFHLNLQGSDNDNNENIPQYALIIVLCHYSSFIFVHEDLPIVLQVTTNLNKWLESYQSESLQMLLDCLYLPLYKNWINTNEAKGMVSACALYIAWTHAISGSIRAGNQMFLTAMIYISVIGIWLYDLATNDITTEVRELCLDNFKFMDDAVDYIHAVYKHISRNGPPPKTRAINSVLLLGACLLHNRKPSKQLVEILIKLVRVIDFKHSTQELVKVVLKSSDMYEERQAKIKESTRQTTKDDCASLNTRDKSISGSSSGYENTTNASSREGSNFVESDVNSDVA